MFGRSIEIMGTCGNYVRDLLIE